MVDLLVVVALSYLLHSTTRSIFTRFDQSRLPFKILPCLLICPRQDRENHPVFTVLGSDPTKLSLGIFKSEEEKHGVAPVVPE
jgi:hypothetical protein